MQGRSLFNSDENGLSHGDTLDLGTIVVAEKLQPGDTELHRLI